MRPSDHSEPPRDQPIEMLPTIAKLIDESLAAAHEHYATLSQARANTTLRTLRRMATCPGPRRTASQYCRADRRMRDRLCHRRGRRDRRRRHRGRPNVRPGEDRRLRSGTEHRSGGPFRIGG